MQLNVYLSMYKKNYTLHSTIQAARMKPNDYLTITKINQGYKIEPTFMFYCLTGSSRTTIILDEAFNIIYKDCGCLEFYKKKECIHTIALYAISLMILDNDFFESEYKIYQDSLVKEQHVQALSKLAEELKTANPYFGMIHLIPSIETCEKDYALSLKIGLDKDYIVKSISYFILCMQNNLNYSYGQKLSFTHSYECLDDTSKDFYNFLRNISNESSEKTINIHKSHLLKLLEIYKNQYIYFKEENDEKPLLRKVVRVEEVGLTLNPEKLEICPPFQSHLFVCGISNAYFINDSFIYTYTYKSRMEGKIFESLFKLGGGLLVEANSEGFISELLPLIQDKIQIESSFYKKYPIPEIKIDSYIFYIEGNIYLNSEIKCEEQNQNSPYLKQVLERYYEVVQSFYFAKNNEGKYNICNLENQYLFLTSDLSILKFFGEIYFDETMKNITAKKSSYTNINVSYNVGLLDFKFENSNLTLEELQAMLIAYHQKKKYIKLKDNTILEIDELHAKEIDDFLEDFNISIKDMNEKIQKPLNYLLKFVEAEDKNISFDDKILEIINDIQNYKRSKYMPSKDFQGYLRGYQLDGFKWLKTLASYNFGGILADDMGLGKTLEIISFIDSDKANKPSLIVCPMSLIYNWENECSKWGIKAKVNLVVGGAEEREQIIKDIHPNKKEIYITSYDSLRRDVHLYEVNFRFIIADEAQFIKNQFAQKSEAIKSLNSEINFALTGTPIENGLADLWSIFDFLMPGYLSNYSHFKTRYESLIMNKDDEALKKLKKRVAPFILRRNKRDVLKDLPDKIEEYYYCKMQSKQKEIYDAYVAKLKEDIRQGGNNILALITRLRQICITPELIYQEPFENTKINMAVDLIHASIDGGHRILVFSQFSQGFSILSKELEKMNIRHFILDGQTKAKTRLEMVEEFNHNEDTKVFLISLKAGGTGLNLVGADMVIHLDPWWNSSAENQATDRAYRIGQTKNVYVIKLICKETIEEKVLLLQNLKKELAESIVHSDEKNNYKFTKQDILDLLD